MLLPDSSLIKICHIIHYDAVKNITLFVIFIIFRNFHGSLFFDKCIHFHSNEGLIVVMILYLQYIDYFSDGHVILWQFFALLIVQKDNEENSPCHSPYSALFLIAFLGCELIWIYRNVFQPPLSLMILMFKLFYDYECIRNTFK